MNTVKEVAKMFNVTERTVRNWMSKRKIQYIKIGGVVRISDEEIQKIKESTK